MTYPIQGVESKPSRDALAMVAATLVGPATEGFAYPVLAFWETYRELCEMVDYEWRNAAWVPRDGQS
jgi:hypothetical protein